MNTKPHSYANLHALVVDDDHSMITLITAILQSMGFGKIERSLNAEKALEMFQSDPNIADIVICDWSMPGRSGLELLQDLREIRPEIPFLMLTANSKLESVHAAVEAGVSQYLTKPFTAEELEKRVRAMVKAAK